MHSQPRGVYLEFTMLYDQLCRRDTLLPTRANLVGGGVHNAHRVRSKNVLQPGLMLRCNGYLLCQ